MAETKRKSRGESKHTVNKSKKKQKRSVSKTLGSKNSDNRKRRGPRLPSSLRKEVDRLNPNSQSNSDDEEILSDEGELYGRDDVYEYEKAVPEEESRKNRRFDPVENFEYKLPEQFEDENVLSDDENEDDDGRDNKGSKTEHANDDEIEEENNGRHARMLQGITGMPSEAFEGKKKNNVVISEAYPESEYNPTREVLDGDGRISIEDLLDPLKDTSGFSKIRNRVKKKSGVIQAPLPKASREKVERTEIYKISKQNITKWEPIIKRNREAPTIIFDEDTDLGFSTVGAIASEFEPRTEFEKKMASFVYDDEVMEAHRKDVSRLLELNEVSVEDEKERQNCIAKLRSLLFRHDMKAKHIKKIKSKTYHRLLKKDRLKATSGQIEMDPEDAKEKAFKQEFKRAEARMRLKRKKGKWIRRKLQRGLEVQDEVTRAAIAEQHNQHALLTRKMNSMNDGSSSSSSDDSSDEDDLDENSAGSDKDRASKLLAKAKEKTLEVLEEEDEVPKSGLFSLPFMELGLEKRKAAADAEAKLALHEYESSLKQLEDSSGAENSKLVASSGRRVFGAAKTLVSDSRNKIETDNFYGNSNSEDDLEAIENIVDLGNNRSIDPQKDVNIDSVFPHEDSEIRQDFVFKSFGDIVKEPGPKTTYEVAIFASDKWRKMRSGKEADANSKKALGSVEPELHNQDLEETVKEVGDDSDDTDSEGRMVDGDVSLDPKPSYELPSQAELVRQAFAADDVEEDFENDKQEVLNEENPEPEKPVLLPGWGQWTHVQKKKGLPSWMLKEHENAKRKREEALKKRKDAHLKHVIISEKLDKKAEKLLAKRLPYPFISNDAFEGSIRMPIGPESNPVTTIGALNRPEVVKRSGVIIKPIEFEEVNPHEKTQEHKRSGQKQKMRKSNSNNGKTTKKMKMTS